MRYPSRKTTLSCFSRQSANRPYIDYNTKTKSFCGMRYPSRKTTLSCFPGRVLFTRILNCQAFFLLKWDISLPNPFRIFMKGFDAAFFSLLTNLSAPVMYFLLISVTGVSNLNICVFKEFHIVETGLSHIPNILPTSEPFF